MRLKFFVYVLRAADGRLYVGQTKNLGFRWAQHLSGTGAWFLVRNRPVAVELVVRCRTREEALDIERYWQESVSDSVMKQFLGKVKKEDLELFKFVEKNFTPRPLCEPI